MLGKSSRIDEEAGQRGDELVAGGAGHRPFGAQRLVAAEDLLDHHIEAVIEAGCRLQLIEITARVGETVDMIDPEAMDVAGGDQRSSRRPWTSSNTRGLSTLTPTRSAISKKRR